MVCASAPNTSTLKNSIIWCKQLISVHILCTLRSDSNLNNALYISLEQSERWWSSQCFLQLWVSAWGTLQSLCWYSNGPSSLAALVDATPMRCFSNLPFLPVCAYGGCFLNIDQRDLDYLNCDRVLRGMPRKWKIEIEILWTLLLVTNWIQT